MSEPVYDLVIRGGTVATASDAFEADVALRHHGVEQDPDLNFEVRLL